jgi:hypothetical protein
MKKTLLIAGALLALSAGMASAAGLNLSWSDCGAAGLAVKTSACTNNAAAGTLYASAISPAVMDQLNGQLGVLDLQTTGAALSPWWSMQTGTGCTGRTTALSYNMDFVNIPNTCPGDPWLAQANPNGVYINAFEGVPNRARIKVTAGLAVSTSIDNATEYGMFKVTIGGARTTGTGACVGCLDGACIVYNDQLLTQPAGVGDYHISGPPILQQHVQWQVSGGSIPDGCPGGTPAKNATWGSIKALYR